MSSTMVFSNVEQPSDAAARGAATAQKKGEAHIAESNRATGLLALMEDVVVSAKREPGQAWATTTSSTTNIADNQLQLPSPCETTEVFGDKTDEDNMGLIAILGKVLALQAKSNANFWSSLWTQASQSMTMQVQFAPIVGSAIEQQYQAQSAGTTAQASQAQNDAWINFAMFGGAIITAGILPEPEPEAENADRATEFQTENPSENTLESDATGTDATGASTGADTQSVVTDEQNADDLLNNQDARRRASATKESALGKGAEIFKKFATFLGKSLQAIQLWGMLSQGATQLNASNFQTIVAQKQLAEGANAATSQLAQMYSQFFNQDFSRMEDLRQGAGQNLEYAMNILQQAANSITQTVTSMFRG
jgi:hypothetical protein